MDNKTTISFYGTHYDVCRKYMDTVKSMDYKIVKPLKLRFYWRELKFKYNFVAVYETSQPENK
jgi:hypothetical protein